MNKKQTVSDTVTTIDPIKARKEFESAPATMVYVDSNGAPLIPSYIHIKKGYVNAAKLQQFMKANNLDNLNSIELLVDGGNERTELMLNEESTPDNVYPRKITVASPSEARLYIPIRCTDVGQFSTMIYPRIPDTKES